MRLVFHNIDKVLGVRISLPWFPLIMVCIFMTSMAGCVNDRVYLQDVETGRVRGPLLIRERSKERLDGIYMVLDATQVSQKSLGALRTLQCTVPSVYFRDAQLLTVMEKLAELGRTRPNAPSIEFSVYGNDASLLDTPLTFATTPNRTLGELIAGVESMVSDLEYTIVDDEVIFRSGVVSTNVTYSNDTQMIYYHWGRRLWGTRESRIESGRADKSAEAPANGTD